jgi:hypothetical protein
MILLPHDLRDISTLLIRESRIIPLKAKVSLTPFFLTDNIARELSDNERFEVRHAFGQTSPHFKFDPHALQNYFSC